MLSKPHGESRTKGKPLTLPEAALFQLINPKAWIITLTGVTAFTMPGEGFIASCVLLCACFAAIGTACVSVWAGFGSLVKSLIAKEADRKAMNVGLGALMLGSLYFVIR